MLHIENLSRRFGAHQALKGVSLEVPSGTVACIVGPSGCGKSTLLRLVAGLDRPDGGTIRLGDKQLSAPGWALEPHRRGLNMVFQDYALWPHMTVERIVGYGLNTLPAAERKRRVAMLLDLLQIGALARRLPSQISGGQQQRVAIARALATEPEILLLDEPLSNLDVQLRLEMRKEFSTLFGAVGKTVLYVTHDPLEAASFADLLVVMNNGQIEQMGAPDTLFAAPRSAWIATLAGFDTTLHAAVVESSGGDGLALEACGQRIALDGQAAESLRAAPVGSAATIMLASSSVTIAHSAEPPTGQNRLRGRVTHSLFEGRGWRTVLDVGGSSISAMAPARAEVGTLLDIDFPQNAALAFPR
jgi:iron(III) transport system ATP-binding protein/putative spermidine/putrescine transport system ATP-binding protein